MLICIHDAEDNRDYSIPIPTDILLNPVTAAIAAHAAVKKAAKTGDSDTDKMVSEALDEAFTEVSENLNLDAKAMRAMLNEAFRILKNFKKAHPDMPLVDIYDADGDRVTITL